MSQRPVDRPAVGAARCGLHPQEARLTFGFDHPSDAPPAPSHPFSRLRARTALLVAVAGALPGMLFVWFWRGRFSFAWTLGGFLIYALCALVLVAYAQARGVRIRRLFGRRPTGGSLLLAVGLAFAVLAFSLGTLLSLLAVVALANPAIFDQVREGAPGFVVRAPGGIDLVSTLARGATVALGAPLVEEFLFRGLVLTRWGRKLGVRRGLLLSALLFGLLHISLQPLGAFVLGLFAGLLYLRTRSLWTAVAAHVTNNTIVVLASSWGEQQLAHSGELPRGDEVRGLLVFGVALFAVSAPLLVIALRRLWPPRDAVLPYDANGAPP
jgi:membrane protease YdiL (CAAX protease family)